jgi:hypothetical protein
MYMNRMWERQLGNPSNSNNPFPWKEVAYEGDFNLESTLLIENTDLNAVTNIGFYSSASHIDNFVNVPSGLNGSLRFSLLVEAGTDSVGGAFIRKQTFTAISPTDTVPEMWSDTSRTFIRTSDGTQAWSAWREVAFISDAPKKDTPHLWPVNTEVDFGDGSFGRRTVGSVTANASAAAITAMFTITGELLSIDSCGGRIHRDPTSGVNDALYSVIYSAGGAIMNITSGITSHLGTISLNSFSTSARTNAPFDVWVIYRRA